MRAQLRGLRGVDVDLETFGPGGPEDFAFTLQVMVGPEGSSLEEAFRVHVCTPGALLRRRSEGVVFGKHLLLVFEPDLRIVERRLERLCSRTRGESWDEVARKLHRFIERGCPT